MAAKPAFPRTASPMAGILAIGLLTATSSVADSPYKPDQRSPGGYYTYADVVSVRPLYRVRRVTEPVRQCRAVSRRVHPASRFRGRHRDDHTRHGHDGSAAAGLVGALVGGVIGHQFGGGNGKKALTVAGAALGASIAGDRARSHSHRGGAYRGEDVAVRRCTEVMRTRQERQVEGYDVRYRYQGRTFNKRVDEHPGDRVGIHVDVQPLP